MSTMNWDDLYSNFLVNVAAAFFVLLLGLCWDRIPKSWRGFRMRQFWGRDLFRGRFLICHATVQVDRSRNELFGLAANAGPTGPGAARPISVSPFLKKYRDGTSEIIYGPSENVMGDTEIRSVTHLLRELSRSGSFQVEVESDVRALERLEGSIVALGSSATNELTRLILAEPNNTFFDFGHDECASFIYDKTSGKRYVGFCEPLRKDLGIILKLPSLRFPGSMFFVCAGLGDWGTSGAAWYLASHWNKLRAEKPESFGLLVEVNIGSDQSARAVPFAQLN
jgi:hypothetical protein